MKLLDNLTVRDKQALMLYLGVVLLCAAFFAAGIFVGWSMPRSYAASEAGHYRSAASSFSLRVLGLGSVEAANRLSAGLRARGHANTSVEGSPGELGYEVKVGPLATRAAADSLMLELRHAGYSAVKIVAETPGR